MAGAGKEGRIYLLDRDNPGKLQTGSDSQIVQSLPGAVGALFGNPAYFNQVLYFCGSGDSLKAFSISNAQLSTAPTSRSGVKFGFPGCLPTVSANGKTNGIVWVIDPGGVLRAYNAANLATELYNSSQNSARDALGSAVKYSAPTVANGKVFAATQDSLVIYGLQFSAVIVPAVGIANAASGNATALAPGSLAAIYGSGLATSTATAAAFPLPTTLAGAVVTLGGTAAPILYASPTQLNIQVPFEPVAAFLTVSVNNVPVGGGPVPIQPAAPGIFLLPQGGGAVVNQNGVINSTAQPAPAGSIVSAYFTGLGAVNPAVTTGAAASLTTLSSVTGTVAAKIGNSAATVKFAGLAPGFAGLYQVNILVPALQSGQYALQLTVNGVASNSAPVNIQ